MGDGQLRPLLVTSQNICTTWPLYAASLLGSPQNGSGNWLLKASDPGQPAGSSVAFMA